MELPVSRFRSYYYMHAYSHTRDLKEQGKLGQATILDKTTWKIIFINAHYLTQQNYFQINGFT